MAVLCLFLWIQLIRFAEFIPRLGPLARVMGKVVIDVLAFTGLYLLYLVGASVAFAMLFGFQVGDFHRLHDSGVALFRAMFGDINYAALRDVDRTVAPIATIVHLAVAGVLLVNLLIALLNKRYDDTHKEAMLEWRNEAMGLKRLGAGSEEELLEEDEKRLLKALEARVASRQQSLLEAIERESGEARSKSAEDTDEVIKRINALSVSVERLERLMQARIQ